MQRTWLKASLLFLLSHFIYAEPFIVPLNKDTQVHTAPNGAQIIYPAEPNDYHVSHNVYSHFNIPREGAAVVNTDQTVDSTLAGIVSGNPNLSGFAAGLIIHQVNHTNPSQLLGSLEVVGVPADTVIINPYGIYCNGCGFINISHPSLITGTPEFGPKGRLHAYRVPGGQITIDGDGLNARQSQYLTLLTRSLTGYAPIWAKEAQIVTGAHQLEVASKKWSPIATNETTPTHAIDVSELGGMYADKISLIGTEKDLGVSYRGQISNAKEIVIDHQGQVNITSSIITPKMGVRADTFRSSGTLYVDQLKLNTSTLFENKGYLAVGELVTDTHQLSNSGTIQATGLAEIKAHDVAVHSQGLLQGDGILTIKADHRITNGGRIKADQLTLEANQAVNSTGHIEAKTHLSVKSDHVHNYGQLLSGGNSHFAVKGNFTNHPDARVWGKEDLIFEGLTPDSRLNELYNHQGKIEANKDIFIRAQHYKNHGSGAKDGEIISEYTQERWNDPFSYLLRRGFAKSLADVLSDKGNKERQSLYEHPRLKGYLSIIHNLATCNINTHRACEEAESSAHVLIPNNDLLSKLRYRWYNSEGEIGRFIGHLTKLEGRENIYKEIYKESPASKEALLTNNPELDRFVWPEGHPLVPAGVGLEHLLHLPPPYKFWRAGPEVVLLHLRGLNPKAAFIIDRYTPRFASNTQLKLAQTLAGGNLHIDAGTIENRLGYLVSSGTMHLQGEHLINEGRTLQKHTQYKMEFGDRHYQGPPVYHHVYEIIGHIPSSIQARGGLSGNLTHSIQNGQADAPVILTNQEAPGRLLPSPSSTYGAAPLDVPSLKIDGNMASPVVLGHIKENALLLPDRASTNTLPYASFIWAPRINLYARTVHNHGSFIGIQRLVLKVDNLWQSRGQLNSDKKVAINAKQGISILGGEVVSEDIHFAANNNIHIAAPKSNTQQLALPSPSPLMYQYQEFSHTPTQVVATNDVVMQSSEGSILFEGAKVAGNNLTMEADKDVEFNAQTLDQRSGYTKHGHQSTLESRQEIHQEIPTEISGKTKVSVKAGRHVTSQGAHVNSKDLINFQAKGKVDLGTSMNLASSFEHYHYEDDDWLFGSETVDIRTERHSQQESPTQVKAKEFRVNAGEGLTVKGSEIVSDNKLLLESEKGNVDFPPRVDQGYQNSVRRTETNHFFGGGSSLDGDKRGQYSETGTLLSSPEITVRAGKNITSRGLTFLAPNGGTLSSGLNMLFTSSQSAQAQSEQHDHKEFGLTRQGIGSFKELFEQSRMILTQHPSLLGSQNGTITLTAGGKVVIAGTDLISGSNIKITAKSVELIPTFHQQQLDYRHEYKKTGLMFGLSGMAVNAYHALDNAMKAARAGDSEKARLYALQASVIMMNAVASGQDPQASQTQTGEEVQNTNSGSHLIKATLSLGQQKGYSKHHELHTFPQPTTAVTQGNLTINATDQITAEGAQMIVNQLMLNAAEAVLLESAKETLKIDGENKHSSTSIGVGMGFGGKQQGLTFEFSASRAKGHEYQDKITHHNTRLSANNVEIKTPNLTLDGAKVEGNTVKTATDNLSIKSPQDKDIYDYDQQQMGLSASLCQPPYCTGESSAGFSYQKGYIDNGYQSVRNQSGIFAGAGGFNIHNQNAMTLIGGVFQSQADPSKNLLKTRTLDTQDVTNYHYYKSDQSGVSLSTSMLTDSKGVNKFDLAKDATSSVAGTAAMNMMPGESKHVESQTKSAISDGTIIITDEQGQLERTGKTIEETLSTLNRDTDTAHQAIENDFDPAKAKRTQELNQIKSDIVQQAMPLIYKQVGNYLQGQPAEVKAIVHGVVSGVLNAAIGGDFAAGAAAGAVTSLVVEQLDKELRGTELSQETQDAILQLTSALIGKVSGEVLGSGNSGNMAAFTAMKATEYNYLSHEQIRQWRKELKECGGAFLCEGAVTAKWFGISGTQDIALLTGIAASAPALVEEMGEDLVYLVTHWKETYEALKQLAQSDDPLKTIGNGIKEGFIEDLDRAYAALQRAGLEGAFEAGVEYGKILGTVGSTVLGGVGLAKVGLKVTGKAVKYAGKVLPGATKSAAKVVAETSPVTRPTLAANLAESQAAHSGVTFPHPMERLGKVTGQYSAIKPGPLENGLAETFAGAKYTEVVLQNEAIFYRAGTVNKALGQFFSQEIPQGVIQTRIDKAILPRWPGKSASPIDTIFEVKVPAGTKIYVGEVGIQGGFYIGGTQQIVIPNPGTIKNLKVINARPIK